MAAIIRKLQESDLDQVVSIWLNASIKAHAFVDREFWESKLSDMRDIYLPSAETYVYSEEGRVEGFISLNSGVVEALFVSPQRQGQGIGGRLVGQAKAMRNCLTLTVYEKNKRSIEFYTKHGFVITSGQIDEQTGEPELVMTFRDMKTNGPDSFI